ncbi:MAG: hypothetical protein QOG56_2878 [Solirubrobacteraceae bacterium]|nr:hypothetical protein [Solirubrobacteraceae bacterium]
MIHTARGLQVRVVSTVLALAVLAAAPAGAHPPAPTGDTPMLLPGAKPLPVDEESEAELLHRDFFFETRHTAGDRPLSTQQAGAQRAKAEDHARKLKRSAAGSPPAVFDGTWSAIGPNPIVQVTRSTPIFSAVSGRIGALAIRPSNGQIVLGAAQGGIWLYDAATRTWSPHGDGLPSLSIGKLAIAPSDDRVIYAGTGEGALSGDSYFGNGVLKSTDGGQTWSHVSGDYFQGVAISGLVVDPRNARHLYASVLRGRGGIRRVTPPAHSRYGFWESRNGGVTWRLLKNTGSEANGATDVDIDPRQPNTLYGTVWGDAIYKSSDGGRAWHKIMRGLPTVARAGQTRFSLGLSHPESVRKAVLYAGFSWTDGAGQPHPARVFKSTDAGASWRMLPAGTGDDAVEDYCAEQCSYDNVVEVDPRHPDVVYVGGQFKYEIASGGIFRSDDGGSTWKNLGWDQHPDFHAVAIDPVHTDRVVIGSDGGVWSSDDRGGRRSAADPLSAVTWRNLNGAVDPETAAVTGRTDLSITQFTSIANVPTVPARVWGGTQDNGTVRKSATSPTWFDVASGDGGQVLVDPHDANFVYGTFFGITPYRYADGGLFFFSNQFIRNGIDLADRSEFYVPWVMNPRDDQQLLLGTYRLYRTDNAKAPNAGDVLWKPISGDLTSGCAETAPNGARGCFVSAIGVGGGSAVYTGSDDGYVYLSTDAQSAGAPTFKRLTDKRLPNRPVTQIAVDRSNYRIAYLAYAGFDAATPRRPGHVFATVDGGTSFQNITGNLPDSPVNSIILDPAHANTLYVATDVGNFVTADGGHSWFALGSGMPNAATWQLHLDPSQRTLAAGTHGRGAYRLSDTVAAPALVLSKVAADVPVGPGSTIDYTISLANIGNRDATGVTITDPLPDGTTFASADGGGEPSERSVTWSQLTVPAGGSATVRLSVTIDAGERSKPIVDDGLRAISAEGAVATGSPVATPIAPRYAVSVAARTPTDGNRPGSSVLGTVTVRNRGFAEDSYALSSSGGSFPTTFLDATCTHPATTTPALAAGQVAEVCVKVDVPATATGTSTATVTATSAASPSVTAAATIKTIAVTRDTLLVDDDNQNPDAQPTYAAALTAAAQGFDTWDLGSDAGLPQTYLDAHPNVVWFTANNYPSPIAPYEARLQAFLDGGGRLLMSGQDILDQAAGTTPFVRDYLHITWDGTEAQNDKPTDAVHGVAGSPVSDGIGAVALDHSVLAGTFEDRITPNGTAQPAFTDDSGAPDALTFAGGYKVAFLAFPLESYGTAGDKADLVGRVLAFFGGP